METSFSDSFALERYGHNLTHMAQQNVFIPLMGYETIVESIFQILLRPGIHKYNPLILDSNRVHRLQIVNEVVRRMAIGEAPDPLPAWQVISLNYEAVLTPPASSFRHQSLFTHSSEEKIPELNHRLVNPETSLESNDLQSPFGQAYIAQIAFHRLQHLFLVANQTEQQVVFFVDSIHRLFGGEEEEYPMNLRTLLVPAFVRRQLQMIGTCTLTQYQEHIERFAGLERRFKIIPLT